MRIHMLAIFSAVVLAANVATAAEKVEITAVKMPALESAIAKHKGKVVVVDFWASFCLPCKKEFPNLVKIHQEQGAQVACISVTVDDPDDQDAALKFLKQQKATFENFLLDEKPELFQKQFGFGAVPCVLVIGKDGKVVKKFTNDNEEFTYKDVRKVVDGLLK